MFIGGDRFQSRVFFVLCKFKYSFDLMILKLMSGIFHDINQQIIFHKDLVLPSKISSNINYTIKFFKTLILKAQDIPGNHLILSIM